MLKQPKKLTTKSGIYLFKNKDHEILYIGKAKNIALRVASYFKNTTDFKIKPLLNESSSIETIITNNETEALYLEATLIKKYKPKFNILLKEGNPFLYLLFTQEKIPTIELVRFQEKKGVYFGPFLTKEVTRKIYNFLMTTFQLKICKKKIPQGCLEFHIGLCSGTCKNDFDLPFYKLRLQLAQNFLKQNANQTKDFIKLEIEKSIQKLAYEKAKNLHEYQENFDKILYTLEQLKNMPSRQTNIDSEKKLNILIKLKERLHLEHIPYIIDCFDISHLQGKHIVGSCVRFVHGVAEKKSFRKFQIKTLIDQDDCAALAEITERRYKTKTDFPHLIIVDGGKGQINAIKSLVKDIPLFGLTKKEEVLISSDFHTFIKLDPTKSEDLLILEIRDYAHHFAISYHRTKRKLKEL